MHRSTCIALAAALSSGAPLTARAEAPAAPAAPPSEPAPASRAEPGPPRDPEPPTEPFSYGDFTWLNGSTRQSKPLLDSPYFTGQVNVDVNYTYSFNRPIDHTVVGSTALARNNEVEPSFVGFGGDFHYEKARGRIMLQLGTRSTIVPRNDSSADRGQFDLRTAYRYISEAYVGHHWHQLHGINLDAGIFMSYIGLFSYDNFENWAYQPSFTSDNTPWFFNGVRLQVFPTDRFKAELWIINGWQTYGKFNELPGVGTQIQWQPVEWTKLVSNAYVGWDTANAAGRVRAHSDSSALFRYHQRKGAFLDRAAVSVTADLGFEAGDDVTPFGGDGGPAQNFVSAMAYHRAWFFDNHIGWSVGGGFIHNPGRYLVLLPTGVAAQTFEIAPGTRFDGWDLSTTLDWMPDEYQTWRLELVHRDVSVPYFAGRGGVTSPDGYTTTPVPAGWTPDLVHAEIRLIAALLFRM